MLANLFFGIYFALSLWYKLTDLTRYGAYISVFGAIITITLNFILIPVYGYKGSAFTILICFFTIMVISYFLGQKYYPIPYNLKRIGTYFGVAGVIYIISLYSSAQPALVKYPAHMFLLLVFVYTVWKLEKRQFKRLFKRNMTK